jgi:hypothetical protein
MKQQMFTKLFSAIVILVCLASPARAAVITTNFSDLVGNQGTVDIQLSLGNAEVLEGFQVFFSENLFSNLSVVNSPVGWDSLILSSVQGPSIFDSFNFVGLEKGVAKLAFTYLGQGSIPELNYEFYNGNFEVTGSGVAANVKTPVPESSGLMLVLLGLLAIAVKARTQGIAARRMAACEVAA